MCLFARECFACLCAMRKRMHASSHRAHHSPVANVNQVLGCRATEVSGNNTTRRPRCHARSTFKVSKFHSSEWKVVATKSGVLAPTVVAAEHHCKSTHETKATRIWANIRGEQIVVSRCVSARNARHVDRKEKVVSTVHVWVRWSELSE